MTDKHYKYSLIVMMIICAIISFLRPLLSVTSNNIEANIFCIPFITRVVANTSDVQSGIEWSLLMFQIIFVSLVIIGLAAISWVVYKTQKNLTQNRKASIKNTIVKLAIYIGMMIVSKTPLLIIWFSVLLGLQIFPEVLFLVVISTLSIWPLFHPFMHTIGRRKY